MVFVVVARVVVAVVDIIHELFKLQNLSEPTVWPHSTHETDNAL